MQQQPTKMFSMLLCRRNNAVFNTLHNCFTTSLVHQTKRNLYSTNNSKVFNSPDNVIKTLRERGLLSGITHDEVEKIVETPTAVYVGFDPTADSLHIGNLVQIIALAHFKRTGHTPIAVLGGATGMIGDPSGRSQERNLLDEDTIIKNSIHIKKTLEFCLRDDVSNDSNSENENVKLVNNMDWFRNFTLIDFLRSVGKNFRVNSMLNKDSVKSRIERESESEDVGMSFTEFSYSLLQAQDFLHLYQNHGCKIQIGGSDQWGNIVSGCDLIKKVTGGTGYGVTLPLLTTATGEKLGKSAGNSVWLSSHKTAPYDFYQYWLRVSDSDVGKLLRIFTFLSLEEIEQIEKEHLQAPEKRVAQKILAENVTTLVHGTEATQKSQEASKILFETSIENQLLLNPDNIPKDVPSTDLSITKFLNNNIANVCVEVGLCPTKSETKRLISAGGLYINNKRIETIDYNLTESDLITGKICVFRSGKKNYKVVKVIK